jgi:hypothetical protein
MLRELAENELLEVRGGCWIADGSNYGGIMQVCAGGGGGGGRTYGLTSIGDVKDFGWQRDYTSSSGQVGVTRPDDSNVRILMVEDPHGFRPGSWTAPLSGVCGMR